MPKPNKTNLPPLQSKILSTKVRSYSQQIRTTEQIPIQQMYNILTKQQTNGIEGYQVVKKYFDPNQYFKLDETNKKTTQSTTKINSKLQKLSYLDFIIKSSNKNTGPGKYEVSNKEFLPSDSKDKKKISSPSNRVTYFAEIQNESKRKNVPGPGKYELQKSLETILQEVKNSQQQKKVIPIAEKTNYLNSVQYYAANSPGPGEYNPRKSIPKLKVNNIKPKDWVQKHKSLEKIKKFQGPNPTTYRPFSSSFHEFGKDVYQQEELKIALQKQTKIWGTEERFKNVSKTKSQMNIINPGPNNYDLKFEWPSKLSEKQGVKNEKAKNVLNSITRGPTRSVYY